jgi:hypothetical protein
MANPPPNWLPWPAGSSRGQVQAAIAAAIAANNAAVAAAADPLATLDLVDDFLSGAPASGQLGVLGWGFAGGTASGIGSSGAQRGIVRRDTGGTANTVAYFRLLISSNAHPLLASDAFDLTWVFRLNSNDADTRVRLGLSSDFTSETPADGLALEKKGADTQWFGCVRIGGVETRTAALAAIDAAFHKLRLRRIDAATVGFTLDAGTEVAIAAAVAVGMHPGLQIVNNVAGSKTLDVDYFRLRVAGLVR